MTCAPSELNPLQAIYRDFQDGVSTFVFGHFAGAHVHLQGRDDQFGHGQLGVALGAEFDEFFPRFTAAHMDVVGLFLGDGCFPCNVASAWAVIVAHEQTHGVGQAEYLLNAVKKVTRVAAGEICTG